MNELRARKSESEDLVVRFPAIYLPFGTLSAFINRKTTHPRLPKNEPKAREKWKCPKNAHGRGHFSFMGDFSLQYASRRELAGEMAGIPSV